MDVKAIRTKLHMSQAKFAARYGIPVASIRDWEQGRSKPEGVARAYLRVIERAPEVAKVLEEA
jgi:putative transcriptional regulator